MAKNLSWFEARTLALKGSAIRRDAWRRWIVRGPALWFTVITVDSAGEKYVVQSSLTATEFGPDEFKAVDWTDEPWTDPTTGSPVTTPTGGGSGTPPTGNSGNFGSVGNPPAPSSSYQPPSSGGSGGGVGSGGGGGPDHDYSPPTGDHIVVVLSYNGVIGKVGYKGGEDDLDSAQACYTTAPDVIELLTTISVAGSPFKVGTLRARVGSGTWQNYGAFSPGLSRGVSFPGVTFNSGGSYTVTAEFTYDSTTITGTGTITLPTLCAPVFTITGSETDNTGAGTPPPPPHNITANVTLQVTGGPGVEYPMTLVIQDSAFSTIRTDTLMVKSPSTHPITYTFSSSSATDYPSAITATWHLPSGDVADGFSFTV